MEMSRTGIRNDLNYENHVKLDFSSVPLVYGRSAEIQVLADTYERICQPNAKSEVIFIHGYSGTGKSTLVQQLCIDYTNKNTTTTSLFVSAKFNELTQSEPYSALIVAFTELCNMISSGPDENLFFEISSALEESVFGSSDDARVLSAVIPNIADILGNDDLFSIHSNINTTKTNNSNNSNTENKNKTNDNSSTDDLGALEGLHRLKFALRLFLRTVCSSSHPLILFLDDLQWADEASLELLTSILTDVEAHNFLFLGAYRDNEVNNNNTNTNTNNTNNNNNNTNSNNNNDTTNIKQQQHPLASKLNQIDKARQPTGIIRLPLGNLSKDHIHAYITALLQSNLTDTLPLTDIVYRKTLGNIFFVRQFLELLHTKQFLRYSHVKSQWVWDMDLVDSETNLSDNVVEIVSGKIRRLSPKVQALLTVASFLGSSFGIDLLSFILFKLAKDTNTTNTTDNTTDSTIDNTTTDDTTTTTTNNNDNNNDKPLKLVCIETLEDAMEQIQIAMEENLLDQTSTKNQHYKFTHDRIQQAAYELVPPGKDREILHLGIGNILLHCIDSNSDNDDNSSSSSCSEGRKEQAKQSMPSAPSMSSPRSSSTTTNTFQTKTILSDDWTLFLAADQLNLGSHHITESSKRLELAELNLRAAQKAISVSAFSPASNYLSAGIQMLPQNNNNNNNNDDNNNNSTTTTTTTTTTSWTNHYGLSLELYSLCAKMDYCIGNFERCYKAVMAVIDHAKSMEEKVSSYVTLVDSLGAQAKLDEAMNTAFQVLSMLEEPFPNLLNHHSRCRHQVSSMLSLWMDRRRTTRLLNAKKRKDGTNNGNGDNVDDNDDELLMLPEMTNGVKLSAMKLLSPMWTYSFFLVKTDLVQLVTTRMVRISLLHGVCKVSAFGFAVYGMLLCGPRGNLKEGYRFGMLAMKLLERFQAREWQARIHSLVYGFIHHWRAPLHESLNPLLKSYNVGMETGDIEYALFSASSYCYLYCFCGMPLSHMEADIQDYCRQMIEYNQIMALVVTLPVRQYVLNLMGKSDNTVILTGEATNQDDMMKSFIEQHNMVGLMVVLVYRMQLAYYFDDIELALQLSKKSKECIQYFLSHYCVLIQAYFDGLISVAFFRKTKKYRFRIKARRVMKKLKRWVNAGACNAVHMLLLLKAELLSLSSSLSSNSNNNSNNNSSNTRRMKIVKKAYDHAIATAGRAGFIQDKALGNELAGRCYYYYFKKQNGDDTYYWASYYMSEAYLLYLDWGANAKADSLWNEYSDIISLTEQQKQQYQKQKQKQQQQTTTTTIGLKGRRRFSSLPETIHRQITTTTTTTTLSSTTTATATATTTTTTTTISGGRRSDIVVVVDDDDGMDETK